MKIAITDTGAYWVQDNVFWYCPVIDGKVLKHDAKPINTNSLSDTEIESLFEILDRLDQE